MKTLINILPAISFATAIMGGTMLAFGNDYGIIGLIPAIIYTFTDKD
jgi:hypothetical protein